MNVQSNFICVNLKLETTQMSFSGFSGWVVRQIVVRLYYGILLINKSKEFHLCNLHEIIIEMKNRLVVARHTDGGMDKAING